MEDILDIPCMFEVDQFNGFTSAWHLLLNLAAGNPSN